MTSKGPFQPKPFCDSVVQHCISTGPSPARQEKRRLSQTSAQLRNHRFHALAGFVGASTTLSYSRCRSKRRKNVRFAQFTQVFYLEDSLIIDKGFGPTFTRESASVTVMDAVIMVKSYCYLEKLSLISGDQETMDLI